MNISELLKEDIVYVLVATKEDVVSHIRGMSIGQVVAILEREKFRRLLETEGGES